LGRWPRLGNFHVRAVAESGRRTVKNVGCMKSVRYSGFRGRNQIRPTHLATRNKKTTAPMRRRWRIGGG
jgi:hypothetical protein